MNNTTSAIAPPVAARNSRGRRMTAAFRLSSPVHSVETTPGLGPSQASYRPTEGDAATGASPGRRFPLPRWPAGSPPSTRLPDAPWRGDLPGLPGMTAVWIFRTSSTVPATSPTQYRLVVPVSPSEPGLSGGELVQRRLQLGERPKLPGRLAGRVVLPGASVPSLSRRLELLDGVVAAPARVCHSCLRPLGFGPRVRGGDDLANDCLAPDDSPRPLQRPYARRQSRQRRYMQSAITHLFTGVPVSDLDAHEHRLVDAVLRATIRHPRRGRDARSRPTRTVSFA